MWPPRVDWTHPSAQGLIGAYAGWRGESTLHDLTGQGCALPSQGGGVYKPTAEGLAYDASGTNGGAFCASAAPKQQPASQVTIFWRGTITATPAASEVLFGAMFNNNSASPFVAWDIEVNSSGQITGNCDASTSLFTATGTAPGAGVVSDAAFLVDELGSLGALLFQNGVQSATTGVTTPSSFDYGTTPNLGIGNGSKPATNSRTLVAYLWNRCLSPREIYNLHLFPYALLEG